MGPGEADFYKCGVTSKKDVDALIDKTVKKWGTVDAW